MPLHPLDLELPKHVDAALAGYLADRRVLMTMRVEKVYGARLR